MDRALLRHDGGWRARATAVVLACAAIAVVLVPAQEAAAIETETFRLQPHPLRVDGYERRSFDFDVEPGTVVNDAIRITNKTSVPRRFRLLSADAQRDPDTGAISLGSRGQDATGMGSWIDLDTEEIELAPRSTEVVGFTFRRPEGQDAAGFGAVVAEEIHEVEGGGVDIRYRLAIIVRLGGRTPDIRVSEPRLEIPVTFTPSKGVLSSTVQNDTLAPVLATVRFSVASLTGRAWTFESQQISLAPNEEVDVRAEWQTVPRWGGVMQPQVEVEWQRGSVVKAGPRGVYPPLWLLALVIAVVGIRGLREMRARRNGKQSGDDGTSARQAAGDLAARFREHGDDPRVKEIVGA